MTIILLKKTRQSKNCSQIYSRLLAILPLLLNQSVWSFRTNPKRTKQTKRTKKEKILVIDFLRLTVWQVLVRFDTFLRHIHLRFCNHSNLYNLYNQSIHKCFRIMNDENYYNNATSNSINHNHNSHVVGILDSCSTSNSNMQ
jgi:hypothetical protein